MTKIWREIADPTKHRDFMNNQVEGGIPIEKSRDNLIKKWVYFANFDGFIFQFNGLDQVRQCKAYFEQKTHPSTLKTNHNPHEHYWHKWYSKLPKGMTKNKNRVEVIKLLEKVLMKWI